MIPAQPVAPYKQRRANFEYNPRNRYASSSPIAAALATVLGSDTPTPTAASSSPNPVPAGEPAVPLFWARGHGACLIASPHRAS